MYIDIFSTRQGWMGAAWSDRGLRGTVLPLPQPGAVEILLRAACGGGAKQRPWQELRRQVNLYLQGELQSFALPLDLPPAGPFTQRVWRNVRAIPYGCTETYGEVACRAGHPGAARAVGNAMARNPVPLVIPCHRVTAADGLGGFTPSLDLKKKLLDMESGGRAIRPGREGGRRKDRR